MERYERAHRLGIKVVSVATNFIHSVLLMIVMWLALDLMQSHVVTKPTGPVIHVAKVSVPTPEVIPHTHNYGYYASLRTETQTQQHSAPVKSKKPLVSKHKVTKAPVLMVKSHPVITVIKKPRAIMVTHKVNKDARGPAPVYSRVDL